MQSFDPLRLQRLIDGELDNAATRQMLSLAEDHPHLWREMALGFVEDQAWEQGFSAAQFEDPNDAPVPSTKTASQHSPINWSKWVSMAAGILVALTIGYLSGKATPNNPLDEGSPNLIAERTPELNSPNDQADIASQDSTLVNFRPEYHLELEDPHGNPVLNGQVPLYSYSTAQRLNPNFWSQEMPSDVREKMSASGYQMNQNTHFISGKFSDGRQFVIPVKTTNFSQGQ